MQNAFLTHGAYVIPLSILSMKRDWNRQGPSFETGFHCFYKNVFYTELALSKKRCYRVHILVPKPKT